MEKVGKDQLTNSVFPEVDIVLLASGYTITFITTYICTSSKMDVSCGHDGWTYLDFQFVEKLRFKPKQQKKVL